MDAQTVNLPSMSGDPGQRRRSINPRRSRDNQGQATRDLLATVSHELRAPLAALIFNVDVLESNLENIGADDARTLMKRIRRTTGWLQALVDNMVVSAQIEADKLQLRWSPVTLSECVETVLVVIAPTFEQRGQRVSVECGPEIVAWGDQVRIEQVLLNLLMNASKYGEPNTEIRIAVERIGEWVQIRVENAGRGVSPRDRERIFAPYARGTQNTDNGPLGLGLGLYIVKTLVERHGGQIGVDSTPFQRTSFWFTIPCANVERSQLG